MAEAVAQRAAATIKGRYLNAQQQYRVLETHAHPRFSGTGDFLGMIGVNVDVTEREEAEKARELLVAELNHRVKNTLSLVQGIAHQSFKNARKTAEARKAFEGRLVALAHAHNLLTEGNWENASLQKLAELALNANGANADRVVLRGPNILLPPKEAVSLAMALHELCTNAMKYGALSNDTGQIRLEWARTDGSHSAGVAGAAARSPRHRAAGPVRCCSNGHSPKTWKARSLRNFNSPGLACSISAPLRTVERLQ